VPVERGWPFGNLTRSGLELTVSICGYRAEDIAPPSTLPLVEEKLDTTGKKPTSRQLQADRTRTLLYSIAISLMEKQGFANTTIGEIAERAGVSIGTFYHYFSSKEEIFYDIFKKADEYFESTVEPALESANAAGASVREQVVAYFRYYAHYNLNRGFANINQLYNTKNKLFTKKGRYMQLLLSRVIERGQERGEFSREMSPDEATDYLFVCSRGVVYDWCIQEGAYDLEQRVESYMRILLRVLEPRP
jgi:TetR/AcrR family transcriptional regulator, fatty acid metabolism regulator protein